VIKEERGQQYQVQPKDVEKVRSILNRMGAGYGLNDKGELVVADNFVKELISSGISAKHVPEYNKDWSHPSREAETVKEEYYDSRGDVEGYVDADELIGERLWVHTNRTHRNQNKNGMIGMYGVNNKGHRTGSPLYYTNCIRLAPPIVFQVAGGKSVDTIKQTGKRTLVAGVSGVVTETREGDVGGGFEVVQFDPFGKGFFFTDSNPDIPLMTGDEVYFRADEEGQWTFLVKNPRGEEAQTQLPLQEELTRQDKTDIKKMVEEELGKLLKKKDMKEQVGEVVKKIMKKLYKDLSLEHPYIIDRIKV
jgi:hypothetical protein